MDVAVVNSFVVNIGDGDCLWTVAVDIISVESCRLVVGNSFVMISDVILTYFFKMEVKVVRVVAPVEDDADLS